MPDEPTRKFTRIEYGNGATDVCHWLHCPRDTRRPQYNPEDWVLDCTDGPARVYTDGSVKISTYAVAGRVIARRTSVVAQGQEYLQTERAEMHRDAFGNVDGGYDVAGRALDLIPKNLQRLTQLMRVVADELGNGIMPSTPAYPADGLSMAAAMPVAVHAQ